MNAQSLSDPTPVKRPPRFVERLRFVTDEHEDVSAYDLVNSLVGVTSALDFGVSSRDEDHERDISSGLATAARVLAEQLQNRLESDYKARRREGAR